MADEQQGVETQAETTPAQQTPAEAGQAQAQEPVKPAPPPTIPYPRFAQKVHETNELKQELEGLKGQISELTARKDTGPPTQEQFDYDTDRYNAALAEYRAEQKVESKFNELTANLQRQQEEMQRQQRLQKFEADLAAYAQANPALDQAIAANPGMQFGPVISDGLTQIGGQEAARGMHHLYQNPGKVYELQAMSPAQAQIELGRMIGQLSVQPATNQQTQAPTPMQPVQGGGVSGTDDPTKAESVEDYVAMRFRQMNSRRT